MKTLKIYAILIYLLLEVLLLAPDDYLAGLKLANKPLLVLTGSTDMAFSAKPLKIAILENNNGEIQIIYKAIHNGVRHNAESFTFIKNWFST